MAAILAILSVSRECIGILNIFYKKVFRSTPLRRGDTLILRSREPVKTQIRSVYSTDTDFTGPRDLKINISPRLGGVERKTFF